MCVRDTRQYNQQPAEFRLRLAQLLGCAKGEAHSWCRQDICKRVREKESESFRLLFYTRKAQRVR